MSELQKLLEKRKALLKAKERVKELMEKKRELKSSKPEFLRWLWWKFPKFENDLKWKRPRGKDNKMRLKLKGYPPMASVGYGTPSELKDLHPSGLVPVVVSNVREIDALDPQKHAIYISSTVGLKKRIELINYAKSKGFRVLNE